MKNLFITLLLMSTCLLVNSCEEDLFTTVKVTYAVKVKAGNTVVIECYNDYYFNSDSLKPITWVSDGSIWRSDHFVYEEEPYYMKVTYIDSTAAQEENYKVQIFYNDTIPVEGSITDYAVPVVEFSGTVIEL